MVKEPLKVRQKFETPAPVSLSLLGVPRLTVAAQPVRLAYAKAEALLYYLAVTGQVHSRAALAALLWSQSTEAQARNSLRNAIYTIRRGLKPLDPLIIERDTIGLDSAVVQIDLPHFRTAIEQPTQPNDTLVAALALWRGLFLDGLNCPIRPILTSGWPISAANWKPYTAKGCSRWLAITSPAIT